MIRKAIRQEIETTLLLSRVSPEKADIVSAQSLVDEGLDWNLFVSFSIGHGTGNMVYRNLCEMNNVPARVIETFKNHYNHTLSRNIRLVSELDRIIDGLSERGVDVITLKGPLTSEIIFGNIGIYPSEDIDILVKIGDLDDTRYFLESEGYQLMDKGFDEYRDYFLDELYHLSFSKGTYFIEPHWNLFYRYFRSAPEFWWEGAIPASSGGRQYTFLSPEKNILYNSFRLYSKAFSQLRFLVMCAEIVRHYKDEIDWDRLFQFAAGHKFESVLRVTMKLSSELLGTPAPARYCEIKGLLPRLLYKYIYRMVLKNKGRSRHPMDKIIISMLRDDISGAVRVFFRRLFPSMGEIVKRYRLPLNSGLSMIYYILNPLLLILRRHQKA